MYSRIAIPVYSFTLFRTRVAAILRATIAELYFIWIGTTTTYSGRCGFTLAGVMLTTSLPAPIIQPSDLGASADMKDPKLIVSDAYDQIAERYLEWRARQP